MAGRGVFPGLRLAGGFMAKALGAHWRTALHQHRAPEKGFPLGRAGRVRTVLLAPGPRCRGSLRRGLADTREALGVGGAGGGEEGSKPDIPGDSGSERHPGPLGDHTQPEKELGWVGPSQMALPISQRGKLRSSQETQQESAGVEGPHCAHGRPGLPW